MSSGDGGCPDFLAHYYEAAHGPFRSLSDLPLEAAEAVQDAIRREGAIFASQRAAGYLAIRRELERTIYAGFVAKGGRPRRTAPHYLIVGACPWVATWYRDGREVRVPLRAFSAETVSLTYGDSFPALRYEDGKPYRGGVYRLDELPALVAEFGLPQAWNPDGLLGPDRYIEAQVWDDEPLRSLGWLASGGEQR